MEEEPEGRSSRPNSFRIMMENSNSKQRQTRVNSDIFCNPGPSLDVDRSDVDEHEGPWGCSEEDLSSFGILGGHLFIPETSAKCVFCAWGFRNEYGAVSALKALGVVF